MEDLFINNFEVLDDEILLLGDPYEDDMFRKSPMSPCCRFICTKDSKCLVLEADGNLRGRDLNSRETFQLGCKFHIQCYDSTIPTPKAIMLGITKDGSKCAFYTDGSTVRCKAEDSLSALSGDSHEAIFFMEKLQGSPNRYTLESSKYRSCFICFEPVSQRSGTVKVVLRHKDKNEVDESCQISFQPAKPRC